MRNNMINLLWAHRGAPLGAICDQNDFNHRSNQINCFWRIQIGNRYHVNHKFDLV